MYNIKNFEHGPFGAAENRPIDYLLAQTLLCNTVENIASTEYENWAENLWRREGELARKMRLFIIGEEVDEKLADVPDAFLNKIAKLSTRGGGVRFITESGDVELLPMPTTFDTYECSEEFSDQVEKIDNEYKALKAAKRHMGGALDSLVHAKIAAARHGGQTLGLDFLKVSEIVKEFRDEMRKWTNG